MRHRDYKNLTRLFITSDLKTEDTCPLQENQIHYLRNVMRLPINTELIVFNGRDGEYLAEITELNKKNGSIKLKEKLRKYSPSSNLWAVFPPIKKTRLSFIIEKATELGVTKLIPVQTEYCQSSKIKLNRLNQQAIEAAEQCERLDIPTIEELQDLQKLLDNWPKERTLFLCAEKGNAMPIIQAIEKIKNTPIGIFAGPEGGFSDQELELMSKYNFVQTIDLGERILRTETALISAIACHQAFNH